MRNFKFNRKTLLFSNAYSSELAELFEKVLTVETEIINGEEVPIRWGVEEVIASDVYKEIEQDSARLKKRFSIFLNNYNFSTKYSRSNKDFMN